MPDPAAIAEAADLLLHAKRPLILVRGGAVATRQAPTALAEHLGAPVLSTNAGKGILPLSHRLPVCCSIAQVSAHPSAGAPAMRPPHPRG